MNCRTSISDSWSGPCGAGARFAHSTASSRDFTSMIQKPAINSFDSVNGPSITAFFPPGENLILVPCEVPCKPDRSSKTPAFASCSLYFLISPISFSLTLLSAIVFLSCSGFDFTIIMNRIVFSPPEFQRPAKVNASPALLLLLSRLFGHFLVHLAGLLPGCFSSLDLLGFRQVFDFKKLSDFDFRLVVRTRRHRRPLRPFDRFLKRLHLDDPIAEHQFLRFRERPIHHRFLSARKLDLCALRRR